MFLFQLIPQVHARLWFQYIYSDKGVANINAITSDTCIFFIIALVVPSA
jgi:hypothetical protein